MSDEPIQPGDLVIVHKPLPCCGTEVLRDAVLRVDRIERMDAKCAMCNTTSLNILVASFEERRGAALPVSILKRIPPLTEEERREFLDDIGLSVPAHG